MDDTILLFEDEGYRSLLPLTYTRTAADIRCGIFTLRERLHARFGQQPAIIPRDYLADVLGAGRWPLRLLSRNVPILLVNSRLLDITCLESLANAPLGTVIVSDDNNTVAGGGTIVAARISPALASAVFADVLQQQGQRVLSELQRFGQTVALRPRMLNFPWDIVESNAELIASDLTLLDPTTFIPALHHPNAVMWNMQAPDRIFVHPNAQIESPVALDAREGPIVIGAARIEPFSLIQGPVAIHDGALISGARVRAGTTIGPVCRIGGEIEATVVQAYSNKHHDGFFGHSYLGEWVNIGAMTTTSDLKNTYGSIKVTVEGYGQVDSGRLKLGCFLADHVKLGIGVHLNGGSVVGTGANIFGVHFAPKTIPPFTWGGERFREYQIDRMIAVARKVMSRRKVTLSDAQADLLRHTFQMTRSERDSM
jgi:UDP-N-acetylglucosamine diphosphorylase / glucose-1-phosphate thymidylyltransferase / UDP-N-acetylgalactosamine diphosphorylase / glucosamine-1-phosphate N-acetyltransferase / galactosamine-1-phosphate N-acetyltransferase